MCGFHTDAEVKAISTSNLRLGKLVVYQSSLNSCDNLYVCDIFFKHHNKIIMREPKEK